MDGGTEGGAPAGVKRSGPGSPIGAPVMAAKSGGNLLRGEHLRYPRIVEDLRHLSAMKLVVDRDHDALRCPEHEHQLHDLGAVFAGDGDPRPLPGARARIVVGRRSARDLAGPATCTGGESP